jgi:integrase
MASIRKLPSGSWRAQVRRKGRYIGETFRRHKDAEEWALAMERRIDRGETPSTRVRGDPTTFGDLIDLHLADLEDIGKCPRRSKAFTLDSLKARLGRVRLQDLDRERLITFGKGRAKEGAGPVTLGIDLAYIKTIMVHAAAVHGIAISAESVDLARVALKRLHLVGKAKSRHRRPDPDEIDRLLDYFENNPRQVIPMGRIVRFAIATAMRQEEICRIRLPDVDGKTRTVVVRDRKDPREKEGNDQKVPLLTATGYDAWAIVQEQRRSTNSIDRVFPYNSRSVGTAFRRACKELGIKDLRFHDLRHEAATRLFEAGYSIERVALVTGHRDWKILKRYTNLRPEELHSWERQQIAKDVAAGGAVGAGKSAVARG